MSNTKNMRRGRVERPTIERLDERVVPAIFFPSVFGNATMGSPLSRYLAARTQSGAFGTGAGTSTPTTFTQPTRFPTPGGFYSVVQTPSGPAGLNTVGGASSGFIRGEGVSPFDPFRPNGTLPFPRGPLGTVLGTRFATTTPATTSTTHSTTRFPIPGGFYSVGQTPSGPAALNGILPRFRSFSQPALNGTPAFTPPSRFPLPGNVYNFINTPDGPAVTQ